MIACTLIAFFTQVPTASGATPSSNPLASVSVAPETLSGAASSSASPARVAAAPEIQGQLSERDQAGGGGSRDSRSTRSRSENCPDAKKAIAYYSAKLSSWRAKMGAPGTTTASLRNRVGRASNGCAHVRHLAHTLQRKAHQQRLRYENWRYYHFAWDHWMPQWAVRLATCEERMDWKHNDGTYEGTFAFWYGTWDGYRLPGYPNSASEATPRQQWEVARRIARKLTVGVPWGCWRGPQHAWVRGGLPEHGFRG